MKRQLVFLSIVMIRFLLIFGCQSTTFRENDEPMKIGKITYSFEYVQQRKGAKISPLYLKLSQLNLPVDRTVCFDGNQSCLRETTNEFGISIQTIQIRNKDNKDTFRYAEVSPHFSVWVELQESRSVNKTKEISIVTFSKKEKTILGYRCKKATIEEEHSTFTVWYTTELTINDPTGAVLQLDSIPGVILEMDEALGGKKAVLLKRTRVTSIDLDVNEPTAFDLPKDALQVKSIEEVAAKNRQNLLRLMEKGQQDHPLSEEEKAAFEGTWVLSYKGDRIELKISKSANDYTIQETMKTRYEPEETQSYKAVFYGETLFVDLAPTFLRYRLTSKGDLKLEKGDFFVFKKQT